MTDRDPPKFLRWPELDLSFVLMLACLVAALLIQFVLRNGSLALYPMAAGVILVMSDKRTRPGFSPTAITGLEEYLAVRPADTRLSRQEASSRRLANAAMPAGAIIAMGTAVASPAFPHRWVEVIFICSIVLIFLSIPVGAYHLSVWTKLQQRVLRWQIAQKE